MNRRIALFSASLPGWSAREVTEIARLVGFAAIEWGVGPDQAITDRRSAAEAHELCGEAGLDCGGVSVQDERVSLASPGRAMMAVELALTLNATHLRVRAPRFEPDSLQRQQRTVRDGLHVLVEVGSQHGLAVLVETSPDTLAPTPESALALIEQCSPQEVGVLYDPGNMIIEGHVEPRLAIARLHRYLLHVHVKNIAWHRRGDSWHWEYSGLYGGLADWSVIVGALASAGYSGRFSIDHLPGRATEALLREEATMLSALVDRAFAAASGELERPGSGDRAGGRVSP